MNLQTSSGAHGTLFLLSRYVNDAELHVKKSTLHGLAAKAPKKTIAKLVNITGLTMFVKDTLTIVLIIVNLDYMMNYETL